MQDIKKEFGKKIKELRKVKDFSQERLAEKSGMSVQTLSSIETGVNYPSYNNFVKLINALDVHPIELFAFFDNEDTFNDKNFTMLICAIISKLNKTEKELAVRLLHSIKR